MSEERDVAAAPTEQAAPETEEDLRAAVEAESAADRVVADDVEPEAEPEPESPEPESDEPRTREAIDHEREQRDSEEDLRLARARVDRNRFHERQHQQQRAQFRPSQPDQEELEHVAMLPAHEQRQYWHDRAIAETDRMLRQQEFNFHDALDRMQFEQRLRDEGHPLSVDIEVETILYQDRMQGINPTRENVLTRVLGKRWLEDAPKRERELQRQRELGDRRIGSQTVRPSGTRSTAANAGGRRNQDQDAEDEALLRSITVSDFDQMGRR